MKFFKWNWMLIVLMCVIVGFVTMGILQKASLKDEIASRDAEISELEGVVDDTERDLRLSKNETGKWMVDAKAKEEEIAKAKKIMAKNEREKRTLRARMVRIAPNETVAKTIARIQCDGIRMFRLNGEPSVVFSEACADVNFEFLEGFALAKKEIGELKGKRDSCLDEVANLNTKIGEKDATIEKSDKIIREMRMEIITGEADLDLSIIEGKKKAKRNFITGTAVGVAVTLGLSLLVGK